MVAENKTVDGGIELEKIELEELKDFFQMMEEVVRVEWASEEAYIKDESADEVDDEIAGLSGFPNRTLAVFTTDKESVDTKARERFGSEEASLVIPLWNDLEEKEFENGRIESVGLFVCEETRSERGLEPVV